MLKPPTFLRFAFSEHARLWKCSTLFLLFLFGTASASAVEKSCQDRPIISGFISDVYYQAPKSLEKSLKGTPFNTLATTLAWSVVETKKGHIDISMYYPQFDALTKRGFCLILLIDTSGRSMRSDVAKMLVKDIDTIPHDSQPSWLTQVDPIARSIDFFGNPATTLDFEDSTSLNLVRRLYRTVLPELRKRYGKSIVAIAPCVTSECEVKYSQAGFRWQSYGPLSQKAFRGYLERIGMKPIDMPMMNYGNHLSDGNPRPQPLYPEMQSFRENSLRDYVCDLTSIIRDNGLKSIGYFGQTFAFSDGIYATGVIEKTSQCFDIAAIDYNFYNGYGIETKPDIPAFLANYALTLGYKKVLVGLYMERFRDPRTFQVDPRGYDVLRASLDRIRPNPGIAGIEIGNLTGDEFKPLGYVSGLVSKISKASPSSAQRKRVAIYACITNSYLWEGEWSNNRQVMQDDLLATYDAIKSFPGIQVDILTDAQMREQPWSLQQYSVIVLPHVSTMPSYARAALIRYASLGGKLMSDMRADDYRPDGSIQTDGTLRTSLGIGATQSFSDDMSFRNGVTLQKQAQYVTGILLAPSSGFDVEFPRISGRGEGLIVRGSNTTTFGFLPLLVQGKSSKWARDQFESEVLRLVN